MGMVVKENPEVASSMLYGNTFEGRNITVLKVFELRCYRTEALRCYMTEGSACQHQQADTWNWQPEWQKGSSLNDMYHRLGWTPPSRRRSSGWTVGFMPGSGSLLPSASGLWKRWGAGDISTRRGRRWPSVFMLSICAFATSNNLICGI